MWKIAYNALQKLYSPVCLFCRQPLLKQEETFCLPCFCRLPLAHHCRHEENPLRDLFAGISHVQDIAAFLFFEHTNITRTLMHAIKYYGDSGLAEQLGRVAAHEMLAERLFADADVLVPVPLHPKKERKRGYNQSEQIACGFSAVLRRPVVSNVLYRQTQTDTQTHKSAYERRLNVEKAFAVRDPYTLAGKHILLVDDVITTGATSASCIEALSAIPHIRISLFFLAIIH
jgi:ComF family protein